MVNSENSIILSSHDGKWLPQLECYKFITNSATCLVNSGDSLFIDFIPSKEISYHNIHEHDLMTYIQCFDFALGSPTSRQFLAMNYLKSLYYEVKGVIQQIHKKVIQRTKINLNQMAATPTASTKATRTLLMLEQIPKIEAEYYFYENLQTQLIETISNSRATSKEELQAPLTLWQEESIRILFFKIINNFESAMLSYSYFIDINENKIIKAIQSVKEDILEKKLSDIYNKIYNSLKISHLLLINNKKSTYPNSKETENQYFTERLCFQLSKLNQNPNCIENLRTKLLENNNPKNNFQEMIDEEIHSLNLAINKDTISKARLEMRLNDSEYPLSVVYRQFVMEMLQQLECDGREG